MQRSDKNINKIPTFFYFQDRKIPTFSYFGMKIPTFSYFFDLSYHFQPCYCDKDGGGEAVFFNLNIAGSFLIAPAKAKIWSLVSSRPDQEWNVLLVFSANAESCDK